MTDQATTAEKPKKTNDAVHEKGSGGADASEKLSAHAQDLQKHPGASAPDAAAAAAAKTPDAKAPEAKSSETKAPEVKSGEAPKAADATPALKPVASEAAPASQAAKVNEAVKPAEAAASHSWLDFSSDVYNLASSAVQTGWDKLSNYSDNIYKSIVGDSDNTKSKVEPKLGADGKPDFFVTQTDQGTKKLGADYVSFADPKAGSIERNNKTGELRSQSADGQRTFTRTADGTEIVKIKDLEYSRTKDGKYDVRNDKGDVIHVNDKGTQIKIDHGVFSVAQHITKIDQTLSQLVPGQLETMPDGQRYHGFDGNTMVARKDGTREAYFKNGPHIRTDAHHQKLEIEDNGTWRALKPEELEQLKRLHNFHQHDCAHGRKRFEFDGGELDENGKIKTADKVTLGEPGTAGKMVAHVPTEDGTGAKVSNNVDGSSDVLLHGHDTRVNPNDPKHLVQGFQANPDGSLGPSDFSYNAQDNSFNTDGVNWDQYGNAALAWNGCNIDADGDATYSNGSSVFNSDEYDRAQDIASSVQYTQQSCTEASAAIQTANGKLSTNCADANDLGSLLAASGDLDAALANAMASENFGACVVLSQAKGSVATAIDAVAKQLAKKDADHEKTVQLVKANNVSYLPDLTLDSLYG